MHVYNRVGAHVNCMLRCTHVKYMRELLQAACNLHVCIYACTIIVQNMNILVGKLSWLHYDKQIFTV